MDQVKFVEGSLILLGPFLNTVTQVKTFFTHREIKRDQ